ncbi:MAG: 50S ribosomal protein L21, partial [Pseudomonadota bacterium]
VTVGALTVEGASVAAEIVEQGRGDKIVIFKKKRRQNYRRKKGHRQHLTTLKVTEILTDGAKPSKKAAQPKAAPAPETKSAEAPAADVAETQPQQFDAAPENADDLTKIAGVGPKLAELLNELGIYTYAQIAAWTPENVAWVDARLKFKGRIERDDWIGKAKELAAE